MRLHQITFKNIKEHPTKMVLLIVALAVGLATVVSLYTILKAMNISLQDQIDEYGANMIVMPKSKSLPLTYAGVTIGGLQYESSLLTEDDVVKIRQIENSANINIVAPKLLGVTQVKGKKAMVAGVRFEDEFNLKKWWEVKRGEHPLKQADALLGGKAAQVLGLNIGDTIDINGESFKVSGILSRVGSQEDELIYIDLKQAQLAFGKPGEVSLVEASAWCKDCPIDDIVEQIQEKIPGAKVSAVRQAAESRDAVIGQFTLFSVILSVTMAVVAVLIVFTNVLSTVRERRREIGIFRAIGYRKAHIIYVILLESGVAGLLAGIVGYSAGFFGASFIAPVAVGIDVGVTFDPAVITATIGGAVAIALVSSLYPALFAARLDPSEAVNSI